MKAIITTGPMTSEIREVPDVQVTPDTIKIRLQYVGVCFSEHYDWKHCDKETAFGHEPMGIVAELGENVKDKGFAVGDRVGCLFGNGLPGAGVMCEYALVYPEDCVKLADNVRSEDGALEPLGCMFSAISKVRATMPGTRICVVGCGYMGCGAISLLKLRGFHVTAVDIRAESLENAKFYGADEVYYPEEALAKFEGAFPVVMEWAETNESLDTAIHLTAECGQLCVGAYHTGEKRLVNVQLLGVRAIDMLNTHPREWDMLQDGIKNAHDLMANGSWKFTKVPTMVYPMNQFDKAQADLETKYGKYLKALIDMTKLDGEPVLM